MSRRTLLLALALAALLGGVRVAFRLAPRPRRIVRPASFRGTIPLAERGITVTIAGTTDESGASPALLAANVRRTGCTVTIENPSGTQWYRGWLGGGTVDAVGDRGVRVNYTDGKFIVEH